MREKLRSRELLLERWVASCSHHLASKRQVLSWPAFPRPHAGSSKAIAIFSQPKYPAAEVARLSAYMTILDPPGGRTMPDMNEPLDGTLAPMGAEPNSKSKLTPDDEVLTRKEKQEAVVELLARVSLRGRGGESSLARAPEPGLGMLPGYLPAVTSVLRFNSRDNPYTEYKSLDDIITEEDEMTAAAVLRRQAMTVMVRHAVMPPCCAAVLLPFRKHHTATSALTLLMICHVLLSLHEHIILPCLHFVCALPALRLHITLPCLHCVFTCLSTCRTRASAVQRRRRPAAWASRRPPCMRATTSPPLQRWSISTGRACGSWPPSSCPATWRCLTLPTSRCRCVAATGPMHGEDGRNMTLQLGLACAAPEP